MPNLKSWLKNILKLTVVLILVYFVGRQIVLNWDELVKYEWTFKAGWFAASVAGHLLAFIFFSRVWCFLISGFGYKVPLEYAFKISYIANLGRYIPGKIWPLFGMTYLAGQIGIRKEEAVASWAIAQLYALPSALLVSLAGMTIFPNLLSPELKETLGNSIYWLTGLTLLASLVMVFYPTRVFMIVNSLLKLIKRPPIHFQLNTIAALKIYLGYAGCWVIYGASFWMFLRSILPDVEIGLFEAVTAFVLAYQIGYLAFFAPGGVGVRELVLAGLLAPFVGPIAAGVTVAARLWNLVIEMVAALIAVSIRMNKQEESDEKKAEG